MELVLGLTDDGRGSSLLMRSRVYPCPHPATHCTKRVGDGETARWILRSQPQREVPALGLSPFCHVYVRICTWRPEGSCKCCSQEPSTKFLDAGCVTGLRLAVPLGWLDSELQGPTYVHLLGAGITSPSHHA